MAHLKPNERWIMVYPYIGDPAGDYGIDSSTGAMLRTDAMFMACETWHDPEDELRDDEDRTEWRRRVWAKLYRKGYRIVKFKLVPMQHSAVTAKLYGFDTVDLWR